MPFSSRWLAAGLLVVCVHGLQAANPVVTLKALANAKYVTSDTSGTSPLVASKDSADISEEFEKVDLGNGTFAFKSMASGKFVSADNYGNNPLIANRASADTWEAFSVVDMGSGRVALKAAVNSKFVCADNYGKNPLIANRTSAQGWETFEMAMVSDGTGMKPATSSTPFTLAVIPDSQFMVCSYNGGTPAMFERQMQWVLEKVKDPAMNVVFVSHVGDVTDNGSLQWQWDNARNALFRLDGQVPYGIAPGNHDAMKMWTTDYSLLNTNIPVSKYASQHWFGGTFQANHYENNFELFEADGMEFIIIHMAWNPSAEVRAWASSVLKQHPTRRAIISTHEYLPVSGGPTTVGLGIWNDVVKSNPNVFLVVCGHNHGENLVVTNNDAGHPVYQILTDYQGDNPQTGRMRYYTFKPADGQIVASTYATETNTYKWNFNFSYSMK